MAHLLVRDLDREVVERLKARAKQHGRSLQGEVKVILVDATVFSLRAARRVSERWRERLSNHRLSDSAALIREDRAR